MFASKYLFANDRSPACSRTPYPTLQTHRARRAEVPHVGPPRATAPLKQVRNQSSLRASLHYTRTQHWVGLSLSLYTARTRSIGYCNSTSCSSAATPRPSLEPHLPQPKATPPVVTARLVTEPASIVLAFTPRSTSIA
eukprot:1802258-Prymnesium_polylepis.2